MTIEEIEYNARLKAHIKDLLHNNSLSFIEIIKSSEGAYPSIVKSALSDLCNSGSVVNTGVYYTNSSNRDYENFKGNLREDKKSASSFQLEISDPHPADYDWRFTSSTVVSLMSELEGFQSKQFKVALFGTTSLFPSLSAKGIDTTLYNKSYSLIDELKSKGFDKGLIVHDLFDPIKNTSDFFDFVVADPPWYVPFYQAFILRSASVLKYDGLLLLSLFPWLTRPQAIKEREEITQFALDAGFDIHKVLPRFLSYATPKFELFSLRQEGIVLDDDWRIGDLFVFRKVRESKDLEIKLIENESDWEDFLISKTKRVKLRNRPEDKVTAFSYKHVDNSKILRSVSRRSSLRKNIDLWTSQNEAYSIQGISLLRAALKLLEQGVMPEMILATLKEDPKNSVTGIDKLSELLLELAHGH